MTDEIKKSSQCPYCEEPIIKVSRDHIFPNFLGGSRKIDSCGTGKKCNNEFGRTIEAGATKFLQPLHVFISSWGLPLRSADPTWKSAYFHGDRTYHLSVGETGVKPELANPIIEKDENGQVIRGVARSKKEAERSARQLIAKGKAKEVKIEQEAPPKFDLKGLGMALELGPDIRRLALKMCIALSTLLPDFELAEVAEARFYLKAENSLVPVNNTLAAFDKYDAVDSLREAVSHLIYVERSKDRVYGLVQFFGVVQIFCRLGIPSDNPSVVALLATLDPVTGNEQFKSVMPLNLTEPPSIIPIQEYPRLVKGWMQKFRDEAVARGATHPPNLKASSIKVEGSNSRITQTLQQRGVRISGSLPNNCCTDTHYGNRSFTFIISHPKLEHALSKNRSAEAMEEDKPKRDE